MSTIHNNAGLRVKEALDHISLPNSLDYGLVGLGLAGGAILGAIGYYLGCSYDIRANAFSNKGVEVLCSNSPVAQLAGTILGILGSASSFCGGLYFDYVNSQNYHASKDLLTKQDSKKLLDSKDIAFLLEKNSINFCAKIAPKLNVGQLVATEQAVTDPKIKQVLQHLINKLPQEIRLHGSEQDRINLEQQTLLSLSNAIFEKSSSMQKQNLPKAFNKCKEIFGDEANEFIYDYLSPKLTVENMKPLHLFAEFANIPKLKNECEQLYLADDNKNRMQKFFN